MPRVYKSTSPAAVDPMVSIEDRDLAEGWHWRLHHGYVIRGPYRVTGEPRRNILLHREVMERVLGRKLAATELVDHINGDKSDNRRENLRIAAKWQNGANHTKRRGGSSHYIGVAAIKRRVGWQSYINAEGKRLPLGEFKDEDEAAWMRDQFALELHGEFATLNFEYEAVS